MKEFKPFGDRVLVLPDSAEAAPKTSGMSMPDSQKEAPTQGVVVAMGVAIAQSHDLMGKRVQWTKYAGRELEIDGVTHKLLRLEELDGEVIL